MSTTQVFKWLVRWWDRLRPNRSRITIDSNVWQAMVVQLGERGLNGRREAGAFLLGATNGGERRAVAVVYFDDLDPDCLVGNIHFRAVGYSKLWDVCDTQALHVIADVHTHPSTQVEQSEIDRAHPMIAQVGHFALILPDYATREVAVHEVGIHEYRGEVSWKTWLGTDAERVLRVRRA